MTQSIEPDQNILRQILVKSALPLAHGQSRLAVFDLDSTLFDVSPRQQKVLEHFAQVPAHQQRFPETMPFFQNIRTERTDWGIRQALERSGLAKAHPEFQEAVRDFWRKSFFSNEYLQFDVPFEGAVDYVQKLYALDVEIIYLTGRDQNRMGTGSPEVLKKWNFPLDQKKARLVLKPDRELEDASFKKDWFASLPLNRYEQVWFFENEPVNINLILQTLPEISIVFFDSTHSGQAQVPDDLPRIKHFLIDSFQVQTQTAKTNKIVFQKTEKS